MLYIVLVLPFFLLALVAQGLVKSRFDTYSRIAPSCGLTGAEAAWTMARGAGLQGIKIERVDGFMSDHYDPTTRTVRLSPAVYDHSSIAALAVACHEVGHAIQHARMFAPLAIRNAAVPMASIGSGLGGVLLMFGVGLGLTKLAMVGFVLFAFVVIFRLINLPVEFDASSRAKRMLRDLGMVTAAESVGVSKMLTAAAMTYVAATLQALSTLLYYGLLIFGNGRRNST